MPRILAIRVGSLSLRSRLTTVRTEVPKAEDSAAISDDYNHHVVIRPIPHHGAELSFVFCGKVHPAGATELVSELLADLAYSRRVHNGSHFLDVVQQEAVE